MLSLRRTDVSRMVTCCDEEVRMFAQVIAVYVYVPVMFVLFQIT